MPTLCFTYIIFSFHYQSIFSYPRVRFPQIFPSPTHTFFLLSRTFPPFSRSFFRLLLIIFIIKYCANIDSVPRPTQPKIAPPGQLRICNTFKFTPLDQLLICNATKKAGNPTPDHLTGFSALLLIYTDICRLVSGTTVTIHFPCHYTYTSHSSFSTYFYYTGTTPCSSNCCFNIAIFSRFALFSASAASARFRSVSARFCSVSARSCSRIVFSRSFARPFFSLTYSLFQKYHLWHVLSIDCLHLSGIIYFLCNI